MDDYADGMRLKNTLSHEVHVTQTSRGVTKLRALSACSQVVQLARVGVRVLVVDVVCVMLGHKYSENQPQTRLPSTITRSVVNRYAPAL